MRGTTSQRANATIAVATMTAANVGAHRVAPFHAHVPLNLATAGLVGALAVRNGAGLRELGLEPNRMATGLRAGLAVGALAVAAIATARALDRSGRVLADERVRSMPGRRAAYELGVRIPIGTGLAEELLFRSALPAVLAPAVGPVAAEAVTIAGFGLWHVFPAMESLSTVDAFAPAQTRAHRFGVVAGHVVATAAAGAMFRVMAKRTGSVLAPVVAHAMLNATMFAAVRFRRAR